MTQQVINTGAVANDGTGESLRNAFDAVNNNFANIWTAGPVDSQVVISNNRISTNVRNLALVLAGNGVGTITVDSTVVPSIDSVYDLGTANSKFDSVYSRYFYGNGAFLSGISNGSGSATSVTFSATPPAVANIGDIWIQSDTGIQYLYFNDNTSNQWAEMEAYQSFSSGGTGNGNVDLTSVSSDIIPSTNNSYSLGSSGYQWKDLWVSNSTIYLNSLPITADGANLKVNGNTVLTTSSPLSFSNLSVTGNVTANAVYTNNYFYANGAPFPQGSNSLPGTTISLKDNVISTTTLNQNLVLSANGVGNVQTNSSIMPDATQVRDIGSASNKFNSIYAGYYYGNGSQLTGINAGNSSSIISGNSNVKIVTAGGNVTIGIGGIGNIVVVSGAGEYVTGVVSASGNITGNYFIGNGSQLTGLPATYGNANVVANLAALGSNPVSTTGNVTGGNLLTGAQVVASGVIQTGTGFSTGGYLSVDGDTDLHKTTVTGNLSATGNITANVGSFFIGNGSQLTGIVSSYGNANVVANLAALGSNPVSTTGNITGGNLTTAGIANVATLAVTGSATVQGSISVSSFLSVTGNVTGGNITTAGVLKISGSSSYIDVAGTGFIQNAGMGEMQISTAAGRPLIINTNAGAYGWNFGIGGNLTLPNGGTVSGTGNITAGYFFGNGSQLTGIVSSYGNANVVANLASLGSNPVSTTGNITSGNISTGTITTTGNITFAGDSSSTPTLNNFNVNAVSITATAGNLSVINGGAANLSGGYLSVARDISATGNITGNFFIGNGSQLTGITAASSYGNANVVANLAALGTNPVSTTGNVTGGNLLFGSGIISGTGNITGGNLDLSYMGGAAKGNLTGGNISVTGNITGGNIITAGLLSTGGNITTAGSVSASSTITGANLSTGGTISATGNVTGGNIVTGGLITASGNITTPGNILNQGFVSSTGNAIHGNILTGGLISATGNITAGNVFSSATMSTGGNIFAALNISATGTVYGSNFNTTGLISATGNVTGNYFIGNGSQLTGIVSSYGNANVVANLAALGSNPVSTTGNISGNYFIGNGSQLTGISTQVTGSWTLAVGTNTVSLTVPGSGTYSIWVNGSIPNGIVTYTATIVVTNTNVPVVGSSYGWYYAAGNALALTAIPNQIVGTLNNISTATVATTTANVFTFGITNNSPTSQIVNYGYTKL